MEARRLKLLWKARFLYENMCPLSVSLDECVCLIGHITSNNTTDCLQIRHQVSDHQPLKFSMLTANFDEEKFGWWVVQGPECRSDWWLFRTYEGRNYGWRDCQRDLFRCSVKHNNVIVTTRADNINQSGQYNFSCGGTGRPVCFSVQVGGVPSQVLSVWYLISPPAPSESGRQSDLCWVCLSREQLGLSGVWSDGLPSSSLHHLGPRLGGRAAPTPPAEPQHHRADPPPPGSVLQPGHVRPHLLQPGGGHLLGLQLSGLWDLQLSDSLRCR